MSVLLHPFILVARAVRAFFRADLRLRRGERGLEVVLDESAPAVTQQPRSRVAARKGKGKDKGKGKADARALHELQGMKRALCALLDEMPENRRTLRHLAFIEYALAKKGLRALPKMPYDVLKHALEQFEGVVTNWSDEGLAALRSKMAVTLIEREAEAGDAESAVAQAANGAPTSVLDTAPLALPVELTDEAADDAEAALRAAYGEVMLPELQLVPMQPAAEVGVEVQGELHSPSAQAIAKAARRGNDSLTRTPAAELQG